MTDKSTVGDYVSLQRGTTYKGNLVGKPGPALLGLGSIHPGGGFRGGDYKTYGGECPEKLMLFPGDLFVSLKGATKDGKMIGSIARVPSTVQSGRLTQDTVKLVFDEFDEGEAAFLYWVLRTPQYREYCAGRATGSAVVALSREDFLNYPVPERTLERICLVDLFEAIEAKIEINRQMNETLEEIARALYKSWFVDFDPVHAKAEGRDTGLPGHIADLFPNSFEVGEIPKGWTGSSLTAFCLLNPESWSKTTRPESIEYVDLANTKWGHIEATTLYESVAAPSRAQRVLRVGDTIVGTVRPGNGSYALVSIDGLTGSTGFAVLRPQKPDYVEFVYLTTTASENIETLAHLADGAAYPAVRPEVVLSTPTIAAPNIVIETFSGIVKPLFQRVAVTEEECETLAAIRDALLPKLISGELRTNSTTRLVETSA